MGLKHNSLAHASKPPYKELPMAKWRAGREPGPPLPWYNDSVREGRGRLR